MIKRKYPYFVNYAQWAERVINYLVQSGVRKYILYPFGERGKMVKSILNVYHGIQEYMIVDNLLSEKYPLIKSLDDLRKTDLSDAIVLITSDKEDYQSEMDEIMNLPKGNFYDNLRNALYEVVPNNKCVELFPRPPFIYELMPLHDDSMSLRHQIQKNASEETAKYIMDNFSAKVRQFANRYSLLETVLAEYVEDDLGAVMEFGVCAGTSINFLAAFNPTKLVYGFDSFKGNPADWHPCARGPKIRYEGGASKS